MSSHVLVVGSFSKAFYTLTARLRERGVEAVSASTVDDARLILQRGTPALVICAAELLDGTYRDILKLVADMAKRVPVIVVAGPANARERQEAIALGAIDCVPRPLSAEDTDAIIDKAVVTLPRATA